jgi:hypothetical protein
MSYANDFTGKLEDAARAYLRTSKAVEGEDNLSVFSTAQIQAGIDDESVGLPRIVCVCDSAEVSEIYDGNWKGMLEIQVIASAQDTTREAFLDMCGEVFAHFFQAPATVCTSLSSAEIEFTAQAVRPRRQEKILVATETDALWVKSLFLEVEGCGSVIA